MSDPITTRFVVTFSGADVPRTEARPGARFEAIIGETFALAPIYQAGPFSGEVLSAPEGSEAEWSGSSFLADLPGVYHLTAANGGHRITFRAVAFPQEAMDFPPLADRNFTRRQSGSPCPVLLRTPDDRRLLLRKIACSGFRVVADHEFSQLTPERPIPSGLDLHSHTQGSSA